MPRAFLPFVYGSLLLSAACTTAHQDLSVVPSSYPPQMVIVSIDTWNAMLAVPNSESDNQKYEE